LPLIAAAFAAGIVLFLVLKYTRSLLAAILVHGVYNALTLIVALLV
jgi:membrane protease YdiL (CAAX protease family)